MSYKADITIIGAGVVGLAVGSEVAGKGREVYILEKNESFGREQSSRNSQSIHAGIYYIPGTFKAKMCVESNAAMYSLCEREGIPFIKCGKINVATDPDEDKTVDLFFQRTLENGAPAKMLSQQELKSLEPDVRATSSFFTPTSGVVDAYTLMQYFLEKGRRGGAQVAYQTEVTGIEKTASGYDVRVKSGDNEFTFSTRILINSAGLFSDRIAAMAGIDIDAAGYRIHYLKGDYFTVSSEKKGQLKHLVYPVPSDIHFGAHVCFDPDWRLRIGPFGYPVNEITYKVYDLEREPLMESGIMKALPYLEPSDLEPESAGVMANLQAPGETPHDYIIKHEIERGLPGFINMVGMDSPALTCSPVIGKYIAEMVDDIY